MTRAQIIWTTAMVLAMHKLLPYDIPVVYAPEPEPEPEEEENAVHE